MNWTALGLILAGQCLLASPAQSANPPANICIEATAFVDNFDKTSHATQASSAGLQQQRAQTDLPQQEAKDGPSREMSTAVERPSRDDPQRPQGQDESQRTSGMSGPVTSSGPGAAGPQGDAQETSKSGSVNPRPDANQQRAGVARPTSSGPVAPPPSPKAIAGVRQAASRNDLDACSAAVREMRLAGVALPAPLLALAALKAELRRRAPQGPAPGVPPIPPSGISPGEEQLQPPPAPG